jgi:4-hydroxy-3-methylbut-2-enyl diphosphate reductase IspH
VREEERDAMNRRQGLTCYAMIVCSLVLVLIARASEVRSGNWTIRHSDEPGKVEFGLMTHDHGGSSSHETDWPISAFQGLDLSKPGKQEAKFTITRDAGRFDCEGYLENGEGAGVFHFTADPNYGQQIKSLGYGGFDAEKQFSMAVLDVSLEFAKQLKAENVPGLDADKLIAFRIHGVSQEMVQYLHQNGYKPDADMLVTMRIHGVTPDYMEKMKKAGYDHVELDKLVTFRIHGVSPEYVEKIQALGYRHVDPDELVTFRIHGVSPEFVKQLQDLGYKNPTPEQLVTMRIHGVSPEYITNLKSRGMKDLTIDQLVTMRIHGID